MSLKQNQAFILIIVTAVISVLFFLALSLSSTTQLSHQVSDIFLSKVKARLSARSGLDKSILGIQQVVLWNNDDFQLQIEDVGDDRNRNGQFDSPLEGTVEEFKRNRPLEDSKTPSFALAEDNFLPVPISLLVKTDGKEHGVSWMNTTMQPDQMTLIRVSANVLDVNAGISDGEGPEGERYETIFGKAYFSNDLTHPFNRRVLELLNAWGNYHKYHAMVRPDKTYDFSKEIDHADNLSSWEEADFVFSPAGHFDRFTPSSIQFDDQMFWAGETITEPGLGDLIIVSRPDGGYTNIENLLDILEQYILSWRDQKGTWLHLGDNNGYTPDEPIEPVSEETIEDIKSEFSSLINLNPIRKTDVLPVTLDMPAVGTYAPNFLKTSFFERDINRQRLLTPTFKLQTARVSINMAPISLLAALIYSVREVKVRDWKLVSGETPPFDMKYSYALSQLDSAGQFENNYPADRNFNWTDGQGNDAEVLPEEPLFSMTESIQLAKDIETARKAKEFTTFQDFQDFLKGWDKGYDAKTMNALEGQEFHSSFNSDGMWNIPGYFDLYTNNQRQKILGHLLNPKLNLGALILDEAGNQVEFNRINGIGMIDVYTSPDYGFRQFHVRRFFDKFDPHLIGATASIYVDAYKIESVGYHVSPSGARLSKSKISVNVSGLNVKSLSSQKDFRSAAIDPVTGMSTLRDTWVTYPEMPGVNPSEIDGRVALKPRLQVSPYGENLRLRVKLNGYGADPTNTEPSGLWPEGQRILEGPNENPARGKLLNSLKPSPNETARSLFPSVYSEINTASDLMPGGGIRVSPMHNSHDQQYGVFGSPNIYSTRKEAMLILRNAILNAGDDANLPDANYVPGGTVQHVLPSFHEGAISFYIKPRTTPFHASGIPQSGKGMQTLFYTNFVIEDDDTEARAEALGIGSTLADYHKWYVASIRLLWGPNPKANIFDSESYRFQNSPPFLVPIYQPTSGFPGQSSYGPYYFQNMTGHTIDGMTGYLLSENVVRPSNGSTIFSPFGNSLSMASKEGHWSSDNLYADEKLQLEFIVTKFAEPYYSDPSGNNYNNSAVLNPTYSTWNSADDMSPLGKKCAYVSPLSRPLNLFDTSDINHYDHHTVRKTFVIDHPFNLSDTADMGKGPRDSEGNHQPMIMPGRWNHIFIAWRNLYDLLNNTVSGHRGGSLAAYINGAFKKSNSGFDMAGLFVQQDYYEGYTSSLNFFGSPWRGNAWDNNGPNPHSLYKNYEPIKHKTITIPWFEHSSESTLESAGFFSVPSGHYGTSVGPDDIGLLEHAYARSRNNVNDQKKTRLFTDFPPRFYFGFEPHHYDRLIPSTPALVPFFGQKFFDGAFMDIQVFARPDSSIRALDGGFSPVLPNFDQFSPYPNDTTASKLSLFPLNVHGQNQRLVSVAIEAFIPEFHQFWDDQNQFSPGPDGQDACRLDGDIFVNGNLINQLKISQEASVVTNLSWLSSSPVSVNGSSDFRIDFSFKGPAVTTGTPIIENVIVTYVSGITYKNFTWE